MNYNYQLISIYKILALTSNALIISGVSTLFINHLDFRRILPGTIRVVVKADADLNVVSPDVYCQFTAVSATKSEQCQSFQPCYLALKKFKDPNPAYDLFPIQTGQYRLFESHSRYQFSIPGRQICSPLKLHLRSTVPQFSPVTLFLNFFLSRFKPYSLMERVQILRSDHKLEAQLID